MRQALRALRRGLEELLPPVLLYLLGAAVITWPAILHTNEVIIGGGELGGWLWRYWWHFTEMNALAASDLGPIDKLYTFLSLGRYPETGNILDVLLLSWPLEKLFDLPGHYNIKIFIILLLDGLCGYALARSLTRFRSVALAAGLVAVINPLNIQDIHGSGLRQVILWWVLLFPVLLFRAEALRTPRAGALAGLCLGLAGAFYWFYGLFGGMFLGMWGLYFIWTHRKGGLPLAPTLRWVAPLLLVTALVGGLFALPYILGEEGGGQVGQGASLPELSFFLPFPSYDTIRDVPLRPSTYEENVLSSLNRTIMSSWSADYLFNPSHPRALPIVVLLGGVLPGLFLRPGPRTRGRFWLAVFLLFYMGTLGPFLKIGGQSDSSEVLILADTYVVRMPYTWMFRWIPGMSRMFGPYRLGSMMVVGAVALVALGLSRLPGGAWVRRGVSLVAMAATMLQVSYRWEVGPVPEGSFQPTMWRAALKVSAIRVPPFYESELDPKVEAGIIEMPLEQQQDLLYLYQMRHHWKVYQGWATPPAVPPPLREDGVGGDAGERMRYLARQDIYGRASGELLMALSRDPLSADLDTLDLQDLTYLLVSSNYRYLVVHERGYYLVDPRKGPLYYRDVVRRLEAKLGVTAREIEEIAWFDYPGNEYEVPNGPVYVPWSSHEVALPDQEMPNRYFMAVFDLGPLVDGFEGTLPEPEELAPAGHDHVEAPEGAPMEEGAVEEAVEGAEVPIDEAAEVPEAPPGEVPAAGRVPQP